MTTEPLSPERLDELAWKPPIARQHCRHYSYVLPYSDPNCGPHCAVGVDLSAPGGTAPCMPEGTGCAKREDWTEEERATWERWERAGTERMIAAIKAIPCLEANQSVTIECPNCGNRLRAERTRRRAYVACETPHCVRFEAALRDGPWPRASTPSKEANDGNE